MDNERNATPAVRSVLTAADAAKELGVSRTLIYALCKAGKIRHERHGVGRGTIRIRRGAFEVYRYAAEKPNPPRLTPGQRTCS